ncbi:hypothetical protein F441_17128 [Phytophthora nicotianae CJ01A1]|uniref:Uncharacterized protein n=2 Tax=Phytophthora nicotianae TaxID=4792 RepID=W2I7U1_PHYNI|nr:hypothetical protein L915_16791 [Phytophthora nicotianae]ETL30319.1 hypothetical protein L916_16701 [Phytophthora nicotianae]ETP06500.1 hypothetical protein F441_17128 [Phytophthora nicotianae CJ01A1]
MNQDLEYDDEEQKWKQEELTGLEEDEVEEASSRYRAYIPQLMDIQQMRALRTALDRSEMQILQQGHLKEYVPRKPASSKLRQWYGLPRNHRGINRPIMSAGPSSRIESLNADSKLCERPATSSRSASTGVKTKEFAMIMKRETRQARGDCTTSDSMRS